MANHKSALKRHRQNVKRNARNKSAKSEIGTLTKKVLSAPKEEALKLFVLLQSKIDKGGRKNLFHKKNASKKVAKIAKAVAAK